MTVYFGNVSHKPSKSNPAGARRYVEGATDNPGFASIFGRSGRVNAISSNAKLSVIDLYNAHSIFIDPQEMEQTSENQFLSQHASMVSNFRALGRYMLKNNQQEMQIALSKIVPAANIASQGDAVVVAVAKKVIGLGNDEEVRQAANDQTTDQAFRETIYRELKQEQRAFSYNVHGIDINVLVRLTGARLVKSSRTVKTTFKVIDAQSQVIGSASTYTRKADRKYKKQMQGFSKMVRSLSKKLSAGNTAIKLEFGHHYDDHLSAIDNAAHLKDISIGDFQEIQREIQKFFDSVQPEDIGLDTDEEFDDFNPASSIRRLWNDLGLASTDISMNINEFNRDLLQKYATGELSAKEVFENSKDYFVPRFQNGLATRFSINLIDAGALSEIMVDEHSDDWRGVDHDELISLGQECIEQAADQYAELLRTTTDLTELLTLYRASNKSHEDQIIAIAVPILIQREGDGLADSRSESAKAIENQLTNLLGSVAAIEWDKWLDNHHISRVSALNTHLNEDYIDNVTNDYLNALLLKADYSDNSEITDNVEEFIVGKKKYIYTWYDQHYDYNQGLEAIRNQLLEILEHNLPYRQVKDGYWRHIVSQINSFTEATRFALTGGIDEFISKYASDWEDYRIDDQDIHEEAKHALYNRMNILLDEYLENKGISRGLYSDVNGDIDTMMGPAVDSNLSIIENLYPQVADKMTIKEFVDSNLQSGNAISGFFNPGYQKVVERIKEMFQADKGNSRYRDYTPQVVFPIASAYGQGLITYDEYIEEIMPDAKKDSVTNSEDDQVFLVKTSGEMVRALSNAMESTGVKPATFALIGKSPSHLVDLEMSSPFIKELHKKALKEGNNIIKKQITTDWAAKYFAEDIKEGLSAIKLQADQLLNTNHKLREAARHANVVLRLPEGSEPQAAKYLERQLNDMDLVSRYFPQIEALLNDSSVNKLSQIQFNEMLRKAVSDHLLLAMQQDHISLAAYSQVGFNLNSIVDQFMDSSLPEELYKEGGTDVDSAKALINSKIGLNWALDVFKKQLEKAHNDILRKAEDRLRENSEVRDAFDSTNSIIHLYNVTDAAAFLSNSLSVYELLEKYFSTVAEYMVSHPTDTWRKDFKNLSFRAAVNALMDAMDDSGIPWQNYYEAEIRPRDIVRNHIEDEFFDDLAEQSENYNSMTEVNNLIKSKLTTDWAAKYFATDIENGKKLIAYDAEMKLTNNRPVADAFKKANVDILIPDSKIVKAAQLLSKKISLEEFVRDAFPDVADALYDQKIESKTNLKNEFETNLKKKIRTVASVAFADASLDSKVLYQIGVRLGNIVNRVMSSSLIDGLYEEADNYSGDKKEFLSSRITVEWAQNTFIDDIEKAKEKVLKVAADRLRDVPEIAKAFHEQNREIVVPSNLLFQASLYLKGTYTATQLFNVINNTTYDQPRMELNQQFKDQVETSVIKALGTVMEDTGISSNVFNMINLSVQSLADRERDAPFVAELKREVEKDPDNKDAIIKSKITPEWAAHHFRKDLSLVHDFIQSSVEDNLLNDPKIEKILKNTGASLDYSSDYDNFAAEFLENKVSQGEFIKKVFPKIANAYFEDGKGDNKMIDRSTFNEMLQKAIYNSLEPIMETTGISFSLFSTVGKGINVLSARDLSKDFANELFNKVQNNSEEAETIIKAKITPNWASKHFADDIDEAKTYINQIAEERLYDNYKIRDAFSITNTENMVPRSHDMDAINFVSYKIDVETFLRRVFPDVANTLYEDALTEDLSKQLDRKKFNKQLSKAIATALFKAQEATGIAPNIYSSVDKGITDLADRDLTEDFANELFKQAQQQPDNMEAILKAAITPEWAAKHFADDIDEGQIFIDQRVEEKLFDNPKVQEAFNKLGVNLLIPRKNDKDAAQFYCGKLSEENFIGLVFPNVAKVLYDGKTLEGKIGKDNLFNFFEGGYYSEASDIINDLLSSLHITRAEYKKVTGNDLDSNISQYSQKAAQEIFNEVYYPSEDYRNQMLADTTRADALGRHAAKIDKNEIKIAFGSNIVDIANDMPGDVNRTSVKHYVDKLLTERIEDILSDPVGMDDLVTTGSKRGWVGIKDDVEANDLDEVLDYAKTKNVKYMDDLKDDISLMFSYDFIKQRLKNCIDEAVDYYADRICDILTDEFQDFNRNQSIVKVKESILKSPKEAVAVERGQLSATEFATKYKLV